MSVLRDTPETSAEMPGAPVADEGQPSEKAPRRQERFPYWREMVGGGLSSHW